MDAMGGGGRPLHYHCYCYHCGGGGMFVRKKNVWGKLELKLKTNCKLLTQT